MKKIFIICMLLCSIVTYSQESKSLEETVKPYVEKLLNGIEKGAEMAIEEIPIVLKQYVAFEAITSWLLILFGLMLLIPTYRFGYFCKNKWDNGEYNNYPPGFFIWIIGFLISLLIIACNIVTAIKATFFPKLFIVESFLNHI